jgi:hypothetical protein
MDTSAIRGVRVGTLVTEVWTAPINHFGALLRFGAGPLLMSMFLWPPAYSFRFGAESHSLTDGVLTLWDALGFLASLPFAAAFAAPWTRLLVTEREEMMGSFSLPFDRRAWQVVWSFIRLLLVFAAALIVVLIPWFLAFGNYAEGKLSMNIGGQGWATVLPHLFGVTATCTILAWFMLRCSLTIPAAAITGTSLSLRDSWAMTRAIQFRMLFAFLILLLAFSLVALTFLFVLVKVAPLAGAATFYVGLPVVLGLVVVIHVLWAGLLGSAYRVARPDVSRTEVAVFE